MTSTHTDRPRPDEPGGTRRPAPRAQTPSTDAGPGPQEAPAADGMPQVDSATLLRGHSSVAITHRGSVYRLQATRQGKLILTK